MSKSKTYLADRIGEAGHPNTEGVLLTAVTTVLDDASITLTSIDEFHAAVYGKLWQHPAFHSTPRDTEYEFKIQVTLNGKVTAIGTSDNLLFWLLANREFERTTAIIDRCVVDCEHTKDSKENTLLHIASLYGGMQVVDKILSLASTDKVALSALVNARNTEGTNPVGMAFLLPGPISVEKLQIARAFASVPEYEVNGYLNNKTGMDYSSVMHIGGTTLLHNLLFVATKITDGRLDIKLKQPLAEALQTLDARVSVDHFNPNYPTMNPSKLDGTTLDGHMISTQKLLATLQFTSTKMKVLCAKYCGSMFSSYEAHQFADDSGDSADESTPARGYKDSLLAFDDKIKTLVTPEVSIIPANPNFHRTFDKFSAGGTGFVPLPIWQMISTARQYDVAKWQQFWGELNASTSHAVVTADKVKYHAAIDSMVVPLFHGVPFMSSQYTNAERRDIFDTIDVINHKLLEQQPLTPREKALIGIHSRTATATAGMQSLHALTHASSEELDTLTRTEDVLAQYFTRPTHPPQHEYPTKFKDAMHEYVYRFATSPIAEFWTKNYDGQLPPDAEAVVKYRFPVIATSKAPDHAIRFAIGRNVEGVRGENPMQPEYIDGHPTHRLAGFLYVTLHKLSDLIRERDVDHTMLDVNLATKLGIVTPDTSAKGQRFSNQLECDFLGKMSADRLVAVIPIVYPNVKQSGAGYIQQYHQAIWGINPTAGSAMVSSPTKLARDLADCNPDIMTSSSNVSGFGKLMVFAFTNLAHGILTHVTKLRGQFLCSVKDTNELVPYKVNIVQDATTEASLAQQDLRYDSTLPTMDRLWNKIIIDEIKVAGAATAAVEHHDA